MKIVEYAKEHPWATGIIVVVGGIIFFMIVFGGGSGNQNVVVNSGPSDAEIAADAQVKAAQISASAASAQAGAAVKAAEIGAGVQLNSDNKAAEAKMAEIAASISMEKMRQDSETKKAQYNYQTSLASIDAANQQAKMNKEASERAMVAQIEAARITQQTQLETARLAQEATIFGLGADRDVSLANLATTATMAQLSAATTANLAANNTAQVQLMIEGQNKQIDGQIKQSEINAGVERYRINSETVIRTNESNANANAQTNIANAYANASAAASKSETDKALIYAGLTNNQINAQKEVDLATINAATEKTNNALAVIPSLKKKNQDEALQAIYTGQVVQPIPGQKNNTLGDIANIAGSVASVAAIFSDSRLKENIRFVGVDKFGRNIYDYNYKGSNKTRRGYMADEVRRNDNGSKTGNTFVSNHGYLKLHPIVHARGSRFGNDGSL